MVNAAHGKNVTGRKADVNDSMWLADLPARSLTRTSFVPPGAVQDLHTLTRTRMPFVRERSAHERRIEKVFEDPHLKLSVVLSDIILGKNGCAVLQALINGQDDPERRRAYIGRVKASRAELLEAVRGRVSTHHRFMLKLHLEHIAALDQAVTSIEKEVGLGLQPFRHAVKLLSTVPGFSDISAHVIVAEIGIDRSRFATPAHLLCWASLCPRKDESAGKRRSTRRRRVAHRAPLWSFCPLFLCLPSTSAGSVGRAGSFESVGGCAWPGAGVGRSGLFGLDMKAFEG